MASVPGNKFQRRQVETRNEAHSPGTGTTHHTIGTLAEVYDTERLESMSIPPALARKLENAPGLLFALVVLPSGAQHVLPFKDPEDYIYLTYGNGFYLEGRAVKLTWTGMNVDGGVIEMARSWKDPHFNIATTSNTFDIGNLF